MQEAYGSAFSALAARVDRKVRLDDYPNYLMERAELEAEAPAPQCELERLRAIIGGMKKRRTWRFTAPLRVLHDWWRRRRRERRAKKPAAAAAPLEGGPGFG